MSEKITDEIAIMNLVKHLYLIEINRKLFEIAKDRNYEDVDISPSDIEQSLTIEIAKNGITPDHIGPNMANLVDEKYITLYSTDNKKTMHHRLLPKGFSAMTSGYFYRQCDERLAELQQRELTEETLKSLKKQKSINFWLILATALAALSPFFTAWVFPPKVRVTVPAEQKFRQDIRIDSVWLHEQVDGLIQKKLSTLPLKEAKERQPPKGAGE